MTNDMKLVTQLRIGFVLLFLLGMIGAALILWNLNQSRLHRERIALSNTLYQTYLSLESHTYQLFKQYGDAIIIGDSNQRARKIQLIKTIGADVQIIRDLISTKTGVDELAFTQQVNTLTEIEQAVKHLIVQLDQFSPTGTGEFRSDWQRLSKLLNQEIDGSFHTLLQMALNREKLETANLAEQIVNAEHRQRHITVAFAILMGLTVLLIVAALHTRLTAPINQLVKTVMLFSEGDFSARAGLKGKNELARVGEMIDTMAEKVASHNARLSGENVALQQAVEDRTRQLTKMLDEIKHSDESRKQMIADVSHELRTPLTIIQGEADVALRGSNKTQEEYRNALERTRDAARHTTRLVDDLLFVARSEAGEIQLRIDRIDLVAVVKQVLQTFGKSVAYDTSLVSARINGDASRIQQALLILLENARQHAATPVELSLRRESNGFVIEVMDAGPGMTDTEKENAFKRFYRGSNASVRHSHGAGLGLPVALSIIQAHGGSITLHDRVGGGLTAEMRLPLEAALEVVA